ncbi:MAG: permease prefix domain 1-containing protein [Gemmatimonadota bacterium]
MNAGRDMSAGQDEGGERLIEEYLDLLYAELRTSPPEARRILAEAEDHLREGMAEGLAAGMTGREAAGHAISSFGSVRAVVRAHERRRRPAVTLLASLAAAAWQLAATGLLAVGASGLVAAVMNRTLGSGFVGGAPSAAGLPAAACRYYLANWPGAHTCGQAWMLETASDAVTLRVLAGLAGLVMLAGYLAARRRAPRVLPDGVVPAVAVTLFGTAGAALAWLSAAGPVAGGHGGPGSYLSGAIAALAVAAGFALPLRRSLLRHARG